MERKAGWREVALLVGSTVLAALVVEAFARVWIALRWPEERVAQMTVDGPYRGRFEIAPPMGYGLRPSHRFEAEGKIFTHDSLGFRGEELTREKPQGQIRIAMMGGSTVYGLVVSDPQTGAAVLQRTLRSLFPGEDILVINAAVPGWDSSDSVESLTLRVLPLSPDMVIVMDGRNDAWPQAFAAYRDDYRHYTSRDPLAIAAVQAEQRRLFRLSHAAMLLAHRVPELFDYHPERFFPVYARVHWENAPTSDQVVAFAEESARFESYRKNLERIVAMTRAKGAIPVLATIVFDPLRYQSGLLPRSPEALAAARRMVLRNIEITQEVAREQSALLFDGFALTTPELMFDDCHPNVRGEEVFARALAEHIAPQLRERISR